VIQPLFAGPFSLRDPYERLAFWGTVIFAFPAALLIGYLLHESIGASQVALFIVVAMIYVTLARGRLLGSSVRIHQTQYPRVFAIAKRACAALDIPMPLIFVREDNLVPVAALGFGEPYALVLSSHWIEVFRDDELAFAIGRELGHIAAGHTRFLSLLSVNGNENPLISLIFGAWLRRCTTSCDKIGLLCCGSLDAAIRSIGVASFHEFGRRVDYDVFAQQHAEIQADSVLRWGAWLGSEPYATARIASLRRFIASPAYERAARWFARERDEEPPALTEPGSAKVSDKDCAGWWRRFAAYAIDFIVVAAVITSFGGNVVSVNRNPDVSASPGNVDIALPTGGKIQITGKHHEHKIYCATPAVCRSMGAAPSPRSSPAAVATLSPSPAPTEAAFGPFLFGDSGVSLNAGGTAIPLNADSLAGPIRALGINFWFPLYLAVLVIVAGQSFGMMISGLRVVTVDFGRPGIFRTLVRYALVFALWWLILPLSFLWHRVLLHDRLTGTRLVKVERVVARATGTG
jgi:uncharacterized RDD family membrane protein YckC